MVPLLNTRVNCYDTLLKRNTVKLALCYITICHLFSWQSNVNTLTAGYVQYAVAYLVSFLCYFFWQSFCIVAVKSVGRQMNN